MNIHVHAGAHVCGDQSSPGVVPPQEPPTYLRRGLSLGPVLTE